jgi:hypothetical protein
MTPIIETITVNDELYTIADTSARETLQNLATVASTGAFSDLKNIPTINGQILNGNITIDTGTDYVGGSGISISEDTITVDFNVVAKKTDLDSYVTQTEFEEDLAPVAKTGRFEDLSDQPTINGQALSGNLALATQSEMDSKADLVDGKVPLSQLPEIGGTNYTAGEGVVIADNTVSADFDVVTRKSYVDEQIGNINSILDTINGEVF